MGVRLPVEMDPPRIGASSLAGRGCASVGEKRERGGQRAKCKASKMAPDHTEGHSSPSGGQESNKSFSQKQRGGKTFG